MNDTDFIYSEKDMIDFGEYCFNHGQVGVSKIRLLLAWIKEKQGVSEPIITKNPEPCKCELCEKRL